MTVEESPDGAKGVAEGDGAEGVAEGDGAAAGRSFPSQRLIRSGLWAGAVLAGLGLLFVLFLALPHGAAAAVLKPVLNVVGGGPPLPDDLGGPAERSVVLAEDGTELATLSGAENRVTVGLDEVPDEVIAAVLAIEDADFYDHAGIDHRALVRATFANLRARRIVQGGSTITQQYVKNTVLTADRTLDRKTTEMRYAIDLENRMSKDEILEGYLNVAYFGEGVYGIATAAEYYYSKTLDELTLDEAALLAGLISQPERTNPAENEDAAIARRDVVLQRMADEDLITADELSATQQAGVELDLTPLPPPDNPFFVEYVKHLLFESDALGDTRDERQQEVFAGGLTIHTTLDPDLQAAAEDAIAEVLTDPQADPLANVVTVEPDTGAIRAMAVGPKDFGPCEADETDCATTQVNPAVPGLGGSGRQPGSAFKPVVLAAALDEGMPRGWQEETDSETEIEGCDDYAPRNFDPQDGGDKEMYEAIEVSNNVYHAQVIGRLQPDPVVTMAQRLGIPDRDLPEECSLALGTATVFPVDMVRAFATFANEGHRCDPFPIVRIEQGDEVLLEHEPDCEEAINQDLALMMTDLLVPPVESGTATAAQLDRPVAGKTGTTDDFRDAWFVGYIPQLVTATWVGYDQQDPMEDIHGLDGVTGGSLPADIWASYMRAAVEDLEVEEFGAAPDQEWLAVPDAVDGDVDDLVDGLEDYDFHIDIEEVEDYRDAGTVIAQEPDPGTEVARGHFLRLQVSDGTGDPPEVPDVIGLDEEEAREVLEDADYVVEVEEEEQEVTLAHDEDPDELEPRDGEVIGQDPAGGSTLEPEETVTITVVRYEIEVEEPEEAEVAISAIQLADDPDEEYVELENTGELPAEVGGWAIVVDEDESIVIDDGYLIEPGGTMRVYSGEGSDAPDRYYAGRDEPIFDEDGGTVQLLDADGDEVQRADY